MVKTEVPVTILDSSLQRKRPFKRRRIKEGLIKREIIGREGEGRTILYEHPLSSAPRLIHKLMLENPNFCDFRGFIVRQR